MLEARLEPPELTTAQERANSVTYRLRDLEKELFDLKDERDYMETDLIGKKYLTPSVKVSVLAEYDRMIDQCRENIREKEMQLVSPAYQLWEGVTC